MLAGSFERRESDLVGLREQVGPHRLDVGGIPIIGQLIDDKGQVVIRRLVNVAVVKLGPKLLAITRLRDA